MRILFFALALLMSCSSHAQTKIAWFSTLQEDLSEKSGFWQRVHDLVISSSKDLNIDFNIYYAEENHIRLVEQVNEILSNPSTRPDGIIFHNYKKTGENILSRAETLGVKSLIFNAGFPDAQNNATNPREHYKHWVGEILPDDHYAGKALLNELIKAYQSLSTYQLGDRIKVLALEGNPSSQAYQARKLGLLDGLDRSSVAQFTQFVPSEWSRKIAASKYSFITERYPNIGIMWSANDNMALGILDGANVGNLTPGRDFVVGGIDWLPESFDAIRAGEMAVTIGGHFVEGMWALILLYDYLNGYDFASAYGTSLKTQMLAITKSTLKSYGDLTKKLHISNLDKMDFSKLTRTHGENKYNFDISYLLDQL